VPQSTPRKGTSAAHRNGRADRRRSPQRCELAAGDAPAYRTDADVVDHYFGLQPLADSIGFLYVHPDGSKDSAGDEFWNATEACCDIHGSGIDDSGYLQGLIRDIEAAYSVDPKRVYVVGHSNGGSWLTEWPAITPTRWPR
jgi:Esterase PHB depolymerase